MKQYIKNRFDHIKQRHFRAAVIWGFIMVCISLVINFYAGTYATVHASNSVTDIILSNIRTYNVGTLFIYSTFTFWGFWIIVAMHHIRRLPFTFKAISLFTVIRSVFISLTHLGPFPSQIVLSPASLINKFSFGADLFFSGHTGLPFLFALIFWDIVPLRITFLLMSIFFAVVVLLGHLHYSIDVLAAFFITFAIFHLAEYIFPKDLAYFKKKQVTVVYE